MRSLLYLLMIAVALAGPVRYLTVGREARGARLEHLTAVREDAAGVKELLGDDPPPPRHLLETRSAALDAVDERVAAFGRALERKSAPDVETLRAAGRRAGVGDAVMAPLLSTIDRGAHAELRRRALAAVLKVLEAAGRPVVEALDVASAPSTRPDSPPVTLLQVGVTALGPPTALIGLTEDLVAASADSPPGDLVFARLEKTGPETWDRIGVGPGAPPVRLTLRVELLMGGG